MRIAITGHTKGFGFALAAHFGNSHEIIGISRTTGYTLPDDFERAVETIQSCDLFLNNTHQGTIQAQFINRLQSIIPIVTTGSMASKFDQRGVIAYSDEKKIIEDTHNSYKSISLKPLLLLEIGVLENSIPETGIRFSHIIETIECWLRCPRMTVVEFADRNINFSSPFGLE